MKEEEALHRMVEALAEADNPDVVAVATFGGGSNGLPGVRVDHADGTKSFLVVSARLSEPGFWS